MKLNTTRKDLGSLKTIKAANDITADVTYYQVNYQVHLIEVN